MVETLSENIKGVFRRIGHAAMRAGRGPEEVKLIAVTKGVSAGVMKKAMEAGLRDFGENRIQEFREKRELLLRDMVFCSSDEPAGYQVNWHLIGHLQKNKSKIAVDFFDLIHSVDSVEIAGHINRHAAGIEKIQRVLVQVKLSDEESKYGILKENIIADLYALSGMQNLRVEGFMTIPPFFDDPEKARPFFRELRDLKDRAEAKGFTLKELSMGMSNDFEVAIEEGATMVRVGTALFGVRKKEAA